MCIPVRRRARKRYKELSFRKLSSHFLFDSGNKSTCFISLLVSRLSTPYNIWAGHFKELRRKNLQLSITTLHNKICHAKASPLFISPLPQPTYKIQSSQVSVVLISYARPNCLMESTDEWIWCHYFDSLGCFEVNLCLVF